MGNMKWKASVGDEIKPSDILSPHASSQPTAELNRF